uniref:Uncharacterized protein n=1 Tax=Arundo donax TaxID=35708 RepID=A0A0A9B3Q2_ARUDO
MSLLLDLLSHIGFYFLLV